LHKSLNEDRQQM